MIELVTTAMNHNPLSMTTKKVLEVDLPEVSGSHTQSEWFTHMTTLWFCLPRPLIIGSHMHLPTTTGSEGRSLRTSVGSVS
jgi:hypothetical protein